MDVAELWIGELSKAKGLEPRSRQTAFGSEDEPLYVWAGRPFCRCVTLGKEDRPPPRVPEWLFNQQQVWTILRLDRGLLEDWRAMKANEVTQFYGFEAVQEILRTQTRWLAWFERDCDQQPLAALSLSIVDAAKRISLKVMNPYDADFVAWPARA